MTIRRRLPYPQDVDADGYDEAIIRTRELNLSLVLAKAGPLWRWTSNPQPSTFPIPCRDGRRGIIIS